LTVWSLSYKLSLYEQKCRAKTHPCTFPKAHVKPQVNEIDSNTAFPNYFFIKPRLVLMQRNKK